MKFAAKRTWPEKAPSWEHEGDADSTEAFAMEFAAIEQLPVDSELVVMAKDGGSPMTQFFKVAGASPYALEAVEPRTGAGTAAAPAASGQGDEDEPESAPAGLPSLSPVISMIFYMGKVAVIATLAIALMAVGITFLKKLLG